MPSDPHLVQRQRACAPARRRASRHGRSAWRSSSRSRAARDSPAPAWLSTRTPQPPGSSHASMRPGDGAKVSGSSALMRHSNAWPRQRDVGLREGQRARRARRGCCCCTMSMPAVISVTGCSTCSARVHLDEEERAVLVPGTRTCRRRSSRSAGRPRRSARRPRRSAAGVDARRRRLLQHLLVAALQRAVAAAEP